LSSEELLMSKGWRTGLLVGAGVTAVIFGVAGALHAQSRAHAACCVAVVDVGQIFSEYDRMKSAQDELKVLQDRLQRENDERKQKSDMLEATLDKMDRDDPTYIKKMNEVLESKINHKTWFELQQANITREVALVTDRIYRDILAATQTIAENAGYDIVLYRDQYQPVTNPDDIQAQMRARKVLYANPNTDITDAVLGKLNADYRAKPHVPELQVP
jgi:Skp family chaperone for outer membrane proteins